VTLDPGEKFPVLPIFHGLAATAGRFSQSAVNGPPDGNRKAKQPAASEVPRACGLWGGMPAVDASIGFRRRLRYRRSGPGSEAFQVFVERLTTDDVLPREALEDELPRDPDEA
jgi:hypothetical protein